MIRKSQERLEYFVASQKGTIAVGLMVWNPTSLHMCVNAAKVRAPLTSIKVIPAVINN
jgi:hypothetical protein